MKAGHGQNKPILSSRQRGVCAAKGRRRHIKRGGDMALSEQYLEDEIHPIDIVENLASYNEWDFDRVGDDQIAMAVEGQWRTYSITLAWSGYDETLRLICTFEMEPPDEQL